MMENLLKDWNWQPPAEWASISTIDMHTGGEPLRVFTKGLPEIKGNTVLEKRRYFRDNYDYLRTALMWEPRGHADMYGAIISSSQDADFDVFFLHNEGYSTMCGHAIIALTKLVLETGIIKKEDAYPTLTINVPCGQVKASARWEDGKITGMSFVNVPSFLYMRDREIEVPGIGNVKFDIAYGGAFYAFADADAMNLSMLPENFNKLVEYGRRIKSAIMKHIEIKHPFEDELSFLYGTIFTGKPQDKQNHSRNVCVFAEGEVDRSATGSGVSARAALHHAKGELAIGETVSIESITGSIMTVKAIATTSYGPHEALFPEVGGTASFTGRHQFYIDPADPFKHGFIFR